MIGKARNRWFTATVRAVAWIVALAAGLGKGRSACGEDRVVLQPNNSSSRIALPCEIIDFNGVRIELRISTSREVKTFPASQVVAVETHFSSRHERGRKLLAEHRYREASASLSEAISDEPREWVRREILAEMIRAAEEIADWSAAADLFPLLVRSDPQTPRFHLIPLLWTQERLSDPLLERARGQLQSPDELVRLIAASWLLEQPGNSRTAAEALDTLSHSGDLRIRSLAASQLWRQRLRAGDVSDLEIRRWESRLRLMPSTLRAGPYLVLARAHELRREDDLAAAAYLWLPSVFVLPRRQAAQAMLAAADALRRAGRTDDAARLYHALNARFSETQFAQDARQALHELIAPKAPP